MPAVLLIGQSGSGKCTLIRALGDAAYAPRKLMAVEYRGPFINTPGEFLENRRFYPALITTAAECDMILMLVSATHASCLIPPQFATMFNRTVLGVVTRADAPQADVECARRFVRNAGVRTVLATDFESGRGVPELRAVLG